jgi:hypothetical protein
MPTKKSSATPGDDQRFLALLDELAEDRKFAPVLKAYYAGKKEGGRKFGSNGLKVNGKLFALSTKGTLVVKLPKERVAELVAAKRGAFFDPGHGRLMKEWLEVTGSGVAWIDLANLAYAYVKSKSR